MSSNLVERSKTLTDPCQLCPRNCQVHRFKGEMGFCRVDFRAPIYHRMIHYGEEYHIVPTYMIFLGGCSMRCSFCSEEQQIRHPLRNSHELLSPVDLAKQIIGVMKRKSRIKNIHFVGGEPTIHLAYLAEVIVEVKKVYPKIPMVLNTNGYFNAELVEILKSLFDLFIFDLKFGQDRCAQRIAHTPQYFQTVTQNILAMDQDSEIIVRHLLLPGHWSCCTMPVLNWMGQHLSSRATVNLMAQLTTFAHTQSQEKWRSLFDEEVHRAWQVLLNFSQKYSHLQWLWNGQPMKDVQGTQYF